MSDVKQALTDRIDQAIDKFRRDLGFTAPELTDMRIDELRENLHFVVEDVMTNG